MSNQTSLIDLPEKEMQQASPSFSTLKTRKLPGSWAQQLLSIPAEFRDAATQSAWKIHDEIFNREIKRERDDRLPNHMLERNCAETTAITTVTSIIFTPLHLIKEDELDFAKSLMVEDISSFHEWVSSKKKDHPAIMVIGDSINEESLKLFMDAELLKLLPSKVVIGPGKELELSMRAYLQEKGFHKSCIASADIHQNGKCWDIVPSQRLDYLIDNLFAEKDIQVVYAIEPVRMPATQQALQEAKKRCIEVTLLNPKSFK